jgi:glycerol-3-phosphate cytidylyltransferase
MIFTGGTFDLFHYGHINFLSRCFGYGTVVVGLNSDELVKELKGKKPTLSYKERVVPLKSCMYVNQVIKLSKRDLKPYLLKFQPRYLAIGTDWKGKYLQQAGLTQGWLDKYGIRLIYIPYTKGISTTLIKQRI